MPTPPAFFTARLLAVRSFTPRRHSTILPVTLAGSSVSTKHSSTWVGSAPARPALTESISGDEGTAGPMPTPGYGTPLPSVTDLVADRSWVLAATVMFHGPLCATVFVAGPLLPADAE